MTLSPGTRLEHYELISQLGIGGMGEVWKALDRTLSREVAIKILPELFAADSERCARFEREARLVAGLNHPNIGAIYGLHEAGGVRFLAMELIPGEDLSTLIQRGPLPWPEVGQIGKQIAMALEGAHESGIVHRDLKPQNVRITPEGKVKVLDFGLAKAQEGGGAVRPTQHSPTVTSAGTQLGVILGTAAYMSPEQAKGKPADRRADIWSFGVVLFEMLTGQALFQGETASELIAAVIRQEIDWSSLPPGTPKSLRALLERCLTRDPQQRLRDIGEARIALENLSGDQVERAPAAPPHSGSRRRESLAWIVAAAALSVAGFGLWRGSHGSTAKIEDSPVRASLPLPSGLQIELEGSTAGIPAISPDGSKIVFGARRGAGPSQLWVLDLPSGEFRSIPNTDDAARPFWSPDSSKIGFFDWSHLSIVGVEGGLITKLAPVRDARGGTWNQKGTIVYAPHAWGPLWSIPATGGTPQQVTDTKIEGGLATDRFPVFLPDGEQFVYLHRDSLTGGGAPPHIEVARLGSKEHRTLIERASNMAVSGDQLLFARDRVLLAQRMEMKGATTVGDPTPLLNDLLTNVRFSFSSFSASNSGRLCFQTGQHQGLSQLVWVTREGKRVGSVGTPAQYSGYGGLTLSRDGRFAAAARVDAPNPDGDIWVFDLSRGTESRLSVRASDESNPVLDSKGATLYLCGSTDEKNRLVKLDMHSGKELELLSEKSETICPTGISADDRWLSVETVKWDQTGRLALIDTSLERASLKELSAPSSDDFKGQISPDGNWMAWESSDSGRPEIFVASFPLGSSRVQISRDGGTQPRWRGDGKELFFKSRDNFINAVPVETGSGQFSIGNAVTLFQIANFDGWTYAVRGDGQQFLVREPLDEPAAGSITLLLNWQRLLDKH